MSEIARSSRELSYKQSIESTRLRVIKKAIATSAGVLLAAGMSGCADNSHVSAESPKAVEKTEVSTPKPSIDSEPLTVESLELSATATPEQNTATFVKRLEQWRMAGATPEAYDEANNYSGNSLAYATQQAEHYAPLFAEALFGPKWQENTGVQQMKQYYIEQNAGALTLYIATSQDAHPYQWNDTLNNATVVSSETSGTETISVVDFEYTETNNADENRVGSELEPSVKQQDNSLVKAEIVYVNDGHNVFVQNYTVTNNQ